MLSLNDTFILKHTMDDMLKPDCSLIRSIKNYIHT